MSYQVTSQVFCNGAPVPVQSWSVQRGADQFVAKWQAEMIDPIETQLGDTWTINRTFISSDSGTGGGTEVLVNEAESDGLGVTVSSEFTKTVRGKVEGQKFDPKISAGKDLYFCNSDWLQGIAPYGWVVSDGAIFHKINQSATTLSMNLPPFRVYDRLLPQPTQEIGTFACITGNITHHQIGQYLANELGADIIINVPDLIVQRVYHIPGTTSLFSAINQIFSIWNAIVKVDMPQPGSSGKPKIHVLDVTSTQQPNAPRSITLAAKAIESIHMQQNVSKTTNIIDHVIVLGAKNCNSTIDMRNQQQQDGTTTTIPEITLTENFVLPTTTSFSVALSQKQMGDYKKGYNSSTAPPQLRPVQTVRTEYYNVPTGNKSQRTLLREETTQYAADGTLVAQTVVKHKWGQGPKAIGTQESTYQMVKVPGQTNLEYRMVRNKIVDQSTVLNGSGLALAKELIEELVLVSWMKDSAGTMYAAAPQTLVSAQNQVSTSKNTNQRIIEQTTKFRDVIVNRATDGLLRQVTIEWDVLNGTSNVSSQTLKDPADQKPHVKRQEHQYRKEFHNGSGPYHEAKTIQHPDMADDLTAQEIAQRVFSRSAVQKMELTVTLTGPVSIPSVACMVTIPDTVVTVASGSNVVTRTISGGSYWLIETRESMHASGGEVQHRTQLKLRNVL